ncbi:MAG: rhamnose utilization protein RhaD (predicted bifunctional aldolase and dehydrogenase) [Bacteroidia bacterium]|jgi:rhamnose utilization protein RhaD (predicted bifunctional aldolase and dehydrogenase)/NAD(P)-dependent dehydrogenase (short-subunit alcohol dehydrogenase family)
MESLWNDKEAAAFADDDLAMRVYTSRLLGTREDLVMHGGGNTSVKGTTTDFFGNKVEVLYVKGSGWDLKTIEKPGFPAIKLKETCLLAELDELSDTDMTKQLRALMLDPGAPSPSVEAILHAIMPPRFIDHTHTDAIITLTNNPRGDKIVSELFPDCLVLPYVMPGFILSKQVNDALKQVDLGQYKGIILMHHGVFTFSDDAKEAYENMIDLVTRAEDYIASNGVDTHAEGSSPVDLMDLASIRQVVSQARGVAQLAVLDSTGDAQGFAARTDLAEIACRGPITPDHVIRTKRIPVILDAQTQTGVPEIESYVAHYSAYFDRNGSSELTMLDPAPRFGIWRNNGSIAFGSSVKECSIVADIARHTRWAIQTGESLGGWEALPEKDIFDLEYWVLEQAKLGKSSGAAKAHQGKVAIVTGANSGIGLATCSALASDGAVVVGLDIDPAVVEVMSAIGMTGIACDLTDDEAIASAVQQTVREYGGLDIIVCNAGMFKAGERIEEHSRETWDRTIAVNLTATQRFMTAAIPFLKLGINPSILVVGSRNYPAPGPGAAAYSVSKAGITQLARVAALELAAYGVRVNVVHPDAVFDTALWTDEALASSAARYDMTVNEYKTKNLLKREIRSADVGRLLSTLASDVFTATTGAQIPIDGGSDRVI